MVNLELLNKALQALVDAQESGKLISLMPIVDNPIFEFGFDHEESALVIQTAKALGLNPTTSKLLLESGNDIDVIKAVIRLLNDIPHAIIHDAAMTYNDESMTLLYSTSKDGEVLEKTYTIT